MKSFMKLWGKAVCCVIIILFILFYFVMPQYSTSYLASFQDKLEREERITEPKIILLGGSSVTYGFDSEKIEEVFGMQVVNMGLHAGIGQTICMDLAKGGIKQDDIVVVLPEKFDQTGLIDGVRGWIMMENHPALWKKLPVSYLPELAKGFPTYIKKALQLWVSGTGNMHSEVGLRRESLNDYGDISETGKENVIASGFYEADSFTTTADSRFIQFLNDYNEFVKSKGAVLVLAAPPIMGEPSINDVNQIELMEDELRERLDVPVITNFKDYYYPKEYFFDTNYHLNDNGRNIRTMQFIEDLKIYLRK